MVRLLAGGFVLALVFGSAMAEDKPAVTTWEREANGIDLKLDVSKDTLKIAAFNGENGVIATCKITVDKDGVVKAKVTDVEEKGNFPPKPKVGLEFTFKWKVEGNTATLSDLTGEGLDEAKAVVEGEYKKKK